MAKRSVVKRSSGTRPRPSTRLWIRLTLPGFGQIGPGKIELLRHIRANQSISAAARAMSMSYRQAWLLVDDMNASFPRPVVAKWMGGSGHGGATLTATGEKLVTSYEAIVKRAEEVTRDVLDEVAELAGRRRGKSYEAKRA
jgi:molybdate transport system regulatory protein